MQTFEQKGTAPDPPSNPLPASLVHQWRRQCPSFTSLDLPDGTTVHRQGEHCEHIYHVASGHVKRETTDEQGHGFIRSMLRDGDFFGAVSEAAPPLTQDSAITKGTTRLYRCRTDEFRTLMAAYPDITDYLLVNLEHQLTFAQRQTEMMLHHSVTGRVALMLRELAGRYGGKCRHGHEVDVRLTQQELAELIGASRPVVSTVLNDLRQRGFVSYTRTFICIDDMGQLGRLEAASCR